MGAGAWGPGGPEVGERSSPLQVGTPRPKGGWCGRRRVWGLGPAVLTTRPVEPEAPRDHSPACPGNQAKPFRQRAPASAALLAQGPKQEPHAPAGCSSAGRGDIRTGPALHPTGQHSCCERTRPKHMLSDGRPAAPPADLTRASATRPCQAGPLDLSHGGPWCWPRPHLDTPGPPHTCPRSSSRPQRSCHAR